MRPLVIPCNKFMSFSILQISCQFIVIVVLDYLLSKSNRVQDTYLFLPKDYFSLSLTPFFFTFYYSLYFFLYAIFYIFKLFPPLISFIHSIQLNRPYFKDCLSLIVQFFLVKVRLSKQNIYLSYSKPQFVNQVKDIVLNL